MAVEVSRMGFGGTAFIDGAQVLVTSGSISISQEVNYLTSVSTPQPEGTSGGSDRTRMKYTDGVYGITGSIGFDLTLPAMRLVRIGTSGVTGLLKRGRQFSVGFYGGDTRNDAWFVDRCYATSFTVSGSVGGLLTGNLSFVSKEIPSPVESILDDGEGRFGNFMRTDVQEPLGYWESGQLGSNIIQSWSLEFSQEASPIYLNGWRSGYEGNEGGDDDITDMLPRYISIGQATYSLSIDTIVDPPWVEETGRIPLIISSSAFTIQAVASSKTWNLAAESGLSTMSFSYDGYANLEDGADSFVISD